jgi:hypothetical protein
MMLVGEFAKLIERQTGAADLRVMKKDSVPFARAAATDGALIFILPKKAQESLSPISASSAC